MNSKKSSESFVRRLTATVKDWKNLPVPMQCDLIEKLRKKDPRLAHAISRNLFPIGNLKEAVQEAVYG